MTDAPTSGTAVTASGTSVDFTDIPSTAKRVTVMFSGVSTNGTSNIQVQLGDSGGVETTGYIASGSGIAGGVGTTASTTGFPVSNATAAADTINGQMAICLLGNNIWTAAGSGARTGAAASFVNGGAKTLSDTLTQVRITTVNGTDTFDAGTINIMWE